MYYEHLNRASSPRKRRLFGVACCRMIFKYMKNEHSREAVIAAEKYADGKIDDEELKRYNRAAYSALDTIIDLVSGDPLYCAIIAAYHVSLLDLGDGDYYWTRAITRNPGDWSRTLPDGWQEKLWEHINKVC